MPIALYSVLLDVFKEPKGLVIGLQVVGMIIYLMLKNMAVYQPLLSVK